MLSKRAQAMLDHGLATLNAAQLMEELGMADDGEHVPRPGAVSVRDLAALSGLSIGAIQGVISTARAKFIAGLIDQGVEPDVAAALCAYLDGKGTASPL